MTPWAISTPLGDLDIDGWTVVWAVVVLLVTLLLARYAARATVRLGGRFDGVTDDVVVQVSRVVRYSIYLLGVGVMLSVLGAPIKPVLVALLLVIAALVLIGRRIADNFGAGLVLQARRTPKLGDLIESSGLRGRIVDMNSRSVVIETVDGVTVHLPNSDLLDEPLLNLSTRGALRSEVEVAIAPGSADGDVDLLAATEAARVAAAATAGVRPSPAASVRLVSVAPHRVVCRLLVWHDPDDGVDVCSDVTGAVARRLAGDGLVSTVSWPPPALGARPPEVP